MNERLMYDGDDGWQERGNPGEDDVPAPLDVLRDAAKAVIETAECYDRPYLPSPMWVKVDALRVALAATPAPLDDYVRVIDVDAWLPQHTGYCANQPEDECSCGVGPEYERMLATAYAATPAPLPSGIEWEDVVDGLEVALSYPAEMEVNRERWRAARIAILDLWDRTAATPAPLDVLVAAKAVVDAMAAQAPLSSTLGDRLYDAIDALEVALLATPAPLDAMTPCLFVPPHEPFYCRAHADVRLRLTDERCRRATPAPPSVRESLERLGLPQTKGRIPPEIVHPAPFEDDFPATPAPLDAALCDCGDGYPSYGIGKRKHLPSCHYGIIADWLDGHAPLSPKA